MAQSGTKQPQSRISGQIIINELVRNMELGRLELGYSILVPCIFSIYLHPDDHARLISVQDIIRENAKNSLLRRNTPRKTCRTARDWCIGFSANTENAVPPSDVEIHSELNEIDQ